MNSATADRSGTERRDGRAAIVRRFIVFWAVASPLLLAAGSREWLYSPEWYIDPWHYVGFFLNYQEPGYSVGAYKLARLPWILWGWSTHAVWPEAAAPLVLHLCSLIASTAGMYVAARQMFRSTRVAALTAILLGFYTPFHGSGGWDYHNAAAGPFHIWTLAALTYAGRSFTAPALALAGGCVALAIHTNITLVNLLPLFAVHLLVVRRQHAGAVGLRSAARAGLWIAAGGIAITTALMGVNVVFGRDPLFFRTLVEIVLRYTADPDVQARWWKPWGTWLFSAQYLALPAATLLVALVATARQAGRLSALHLLAIGEFVAIVLIWCLWQSFGQTALDFDYFAYPLIPHTFLAIGALLHALPGRPSTVAIVAAPLVLAATLFSNVAASVQPFLPASVAMAPAVAAFATWLAAAAALWRPGRVGLAAFLLLFSCGNALTSAGTGRGSTAYAFANPCRTASAFHAAVVTAYRFVTETDPALQNVTIWFEEDAELPVGGQCHVDMGALGYALAGAGVPYVATPFPMPPIEKLSQGAVEQTTRSRRTLVVLSGNPTADRRVATHLATFDMGVTPRRRRTVDVLDGEFFVWLLDLQPRAGETNRLRAVPSEPLAEWSADALKRTATVFAYAPGTTASLTEDADGHVVFVPRTTQDHLATPFLPVRETGGERGLSVDLEPAPDAANNCSVHIQNQDLKDLGAVSCAAAAGARSGLLPLDGDVKAIRIYFMDTSLEPIVLPESIAISLHANPPAPAAPAAR